MHKTENKLNLTLLTSSLALSLTIGHTDSLQNHTRFSCPLPPSWNQSVFPYLPSLNWYSETFCGPPRRFWRTYCPVMLLPCCPVLLFLSSLPSSPFCGLTKTCQINSCECLCLIKPLARIPL